MAIDMFMMVDGIEGESQDAAHANEIDVLAWSWGASQSGNTHMSAGAGGGGKVSVQDLSFTKYIDSATHALLQKCFNGGPIAEAELVVRKAGGTAMEYLKITMRDVIVGSVSMGGSGGEDRLTENVTLNFSQVTLAYFPQKDDGTADAEKLAGWDIAANETLV